MENNNTFVHFVINNKSIIIQIEKTLSEYEVIKLKYALTNAQKQLNKDLEKFIIDMTTSIEVNNIEKTVFYCKRFTKSGCNKIKRGLNIKFGIPYSHEIKYPSKREKQI